MARIDLLRSFSCARDRARIKDEAHTLKGASGTFGLRQVSDLARTLEYSAYTIAEAEYHNVVARLDACFQRGREEAERIGFSGGFVMVPTGPTFQTGNEALEFDPAGTLSITTLWL